MCWFPWCWQNSSLCPFFFAVIFAAALHLSQRSCRVSCGVVSVSVILIVFLV